MSEVTPEEELDIEEPTEYTTEPEDTDGPQDEVTEGTVAELMRDNDIDS
jgi:hypothetical protein